MVVWCSRCVCSLPYLAYMSHFKMVCWYRVCWGRNSRPLRSWTTSHVNIQIIKSDKRAPNLPPHKYPPKMHPKIRPEKKHHLRKSKLECQEAKITQVSHKPIASVSQTNMLCSSWTTSESPTSRRSLPTFLEELPEAGLLLRRHTWGSSSTHESEHLSLQVIEDHSPGLNPWGKTIEICTIRHHATVSVELLVIILS